jgi:hypothetical protein
MRASLAHVMERVEPGGSRPLRVDGLLPPHRERARTCRHVAICFCQLDLAPFDGLIWPHPQHELLGS